MNFWEKLKKVFTANIAYTVVLVFGFILFLYFAGGDLIGGALTAVSALVVYVCAALLYGEYKKIPNAKPAAKKPAKRKK